MPRKTIRIAEDVYETLLSQKLPAESFSDELRKLAQPKGKISECAGLWARWMTKKQMSDISSAIAEARRFSAAARKEKMRMLYR